MALGKTVERKFERYAGQVLVAVPVIEYSEMLFDNSVSALLETGGGTHRVEVPSRIFNRDTEEILGSAEGVYPDGRNLIRFASAIQDEGQSAYVYEDEVRVVKECASCKQLLPSAYSKPTSIDVNGETKDYSKPYISYEEICRLAGSPSRDLTVTYKGGVEDHSMGLLHPGKSVKVKPQMSITAVQTGNA